ncbi:hypothetical protein [Methylobacterium indicum]|uniref:Uncharacterized protein n=1 Tax=Methylobacterium indicum TaxID=1775910 RepID=A0A8H8WYE8_9HYPH|nr:hypothetical protein [Methylobacterium indicum]BCM86482.1 hypothetical protein mvi_49430 [Methylobacterium indicum]
MEKQHVWDRLEACVPDDAVVRRHPTLHILAAAVEHDFEMISTSTKVALAAAKKWSKRISGRRATRSW